MNVKKLVITLLLLTNIAPESHAMMTRLAALRPTLSSRFATTNMASMKPSVNWQSMSTTSYKNFMPTSSSFANTHKPLLPTFANNAVSRPFTTKKDDQNNKSNNRFWYLGGILGAGLFAGLNNKTVAHAQGQEDSLPATVKIEFNKKSLITYRNDKKLQQKFIDYATSHMTTKDAQEIEAIVHIIQNDNQYHAAITLLSAAINKRQLPLIHENIVQALKKFELPLIDFTLKNFSTTSVATMEWCYDLLEKEQARLIIALRSLPHLERKPLKQSITITKMQKQQFQDLAEADTRFQRNPQENILDFLIQDNTNKLTPEQEADAKLAEYENETSLKKFVSRVARNDRPFFMNKYIQCTTTNHDAIPTDKHICANSGVVAQMLLHYPKPARDPNVLNAFKRIQKIERQEAAKGNVTLIHNQGSSREPGYSWDYLSQIQGMAYNLSVPENERIGENKRILRFDNAKTKWTHSKDDGIYANASLFGNSGTFSYCTAQMFMDGFDWSEGKSKQYSTESLFNNFDLTMYNQKYNNQEYRETLQKNKTLLAQCYKEHKNEFDALAQLHNEANPNNYGHMLVFSLPAKWAGKVFPTDWNARLEPVWVNNKKTVNFQKIRSTLCTDPSQIKNSNDHQFYMLLDEDTKNPVKGPDIFPVHAYIPEKHKQFVKARDTLFTKLDQKMKAAKNT
ncbi:MAG: hypothetical protein NTX86_03295 [Candidatus Dependentiae bacterium]|nr:hypothetical protein [Candidatus Dependentiae bacterium]